MKTLHSLVIVGNAGGTNVGWSLFDGARQLGLSATFCDATRAFRAPAWLARLNWRLRGHRPTRLRAFSTQVAETCARARPDWLLTTGMAPVEAEALGSIGRMGIQRISYLTDDPWNELFKAEWFFDALPHYDRVFSTRRANLADLKGCGCANASYLPFGYDPALFAGDEPAVNCQRLVPQADVLFVGGADRDRVRYAEAIIGEGFRVALYGAYWDRFRVTRPCAYGQADPATVRKATRATKVALCLVRRANRDGHVMRSFEIPAIGGCLLAEDTHEHREVLGPEGNAVLYFSGIDQMLAKLRWLLDRPQERQRLAQAAHRLIVSGRNTYRDRLITMLGLNASAGQQSAASTQALAP